MFLSKNFLSKNRFLLISVILVLVFVVSYKKYDDSYDYSITLAGNSDIKYWTDLDGVYPVVAITNSTTWPLVSQLSEKIDKDFSRLAKGVFIIDYSGQEYDLLRSHTESMNQRIWLLENFDGSHYALYPFEMLPAYYFIDGENIARGPFYKRNALLKEMLKQRRLDISAKRLT